MDIIHQCGRITLSKGTHLYHWSKNENLMDKNLHNNFFTCLENSSWQLFGKKLYIFKLKQDIELVLMIQNLKIKGNNNSPNISNKDKIRDYQVLTDIYNDVCGEKYDSMGDVELKKNKKDLGNLCKILNEHEHGHQGFFNYIDSEKGCFEIVIFNPNDYLTFVESFDKCDVKLHKLKDNKRIMQSKKVKYAYPYNYEYIKKKRHDTRPSIFYYIWKYKNK